MPFIEVEGFVSFVDIINPGTAEVFPYSTGNEVFSNYYQGTGFDPDITYYFYCDWYIDAVLVATDSGWWMSSHGGVLNIMMEETINIGSYSVGNHNVSCFWEIESNPHDYEDHTHDWTRDSSPPPPAPSVVFTTPPNPGTSYDYSTSTTYTCEWTIEDEDSDITSMILYMNDILQFDFEDQPEGDYSFPVTMDSDQTYILKVNGTDSQSNDYSTSTSVIAYNATQYLDVGLPLGQYHNSEIAFQIESGAPDGLHNMSYSVENYAWFSSNVTENRVDEVLDTTYLYEFGLLNWSQYIPDLDIDIGDRYETSANWWNTDWDKRQTITITNPTASQIDNRAWYIDVTWDSDMQPDFDDLRFTTTGGTPTQLDHETADHVASTSAEVWLKIPSITGSGTYDIEMYYDNDGASDDSTTDTWSNNYQVVAHFNGVLGTNSFTDSSANAFTWAPFNSPEILYDGYCGKAGRFDGASDAFTMTDSGGALDDYTAATGWGWVKSDDNYDEGGIISTWSTANLRFYAATRTSSTEITTVRIGAELDQGTGEYGVPLDWIHFAFT